VLAHALSGRLRTNHRAGGRRLPQRGGVARPLLPRRPAPPILIHMQAGYEDELAGEEIAADRDGAVAVLGRLGPSPRPRRTPSDAVGLSLGGGAPRRGRRFLALRATSDDRGVECGAQVRILPHQGVFQREFQRCGRDGRIGPRMASMALISGDLGGVAPVGRAFGPRRGRRSRYSWSEPVGEASWEGPG
jgi:hypothetical protein